MTFLLSTLRDWLVKFDAIALVNPALSQKKNGKYQKVIRRKSQRKCHNTHRSTDQLNETSEIEASATPPTIGIMAPITHGVGA